jgi:uncharacterized protein YjbI with pentapeptide repeats
MAATGLVVVMAPRIAAPNRTEKLILPERGQAMLEQVATWFVKEVLGPRRRALFLLGIDMRILSLRVGHWWRRPKASVIRNYWRKPVALILVGLLVPTIIFWLLATLFPAEARGLAAAFHNLLTQPETFRLEWREAAQILLLLIGVPSGFLLWLFRDVNVSGTLENQRKDVNLKEFQEIQMRAAGAMDEKLPAAARETLQIAALHQLRAFLRGEYGDSFRRPAFELLRARLVASAKVTGTQDIADWMAKWRGERPDRLAEQLAGIDDMQRQIKLAIHMQRPSSVAAAERAIVREEWDAIFGRGLPLASTAFDTIALHDGELLCGIDAFACRFIGASMAGIHLERANLVGAVFTGAALTRAHLEGADLSRAYLEMADLEGAHLDHTKLVGAQLEKANLDRASLSHADLSRAHLQSAHMINVQLVGADLSKAVLANADLFFANLKGADLFRCNLAGANLATVEPERIGSLAGATISHDTILTQDWRKLSEDRRNDVRKRWLDCGAVMAK